MEIAGGRLVLEVGRAAEEEGSEEEVLVLEYSWEGADNGLPFCLIVVLVGTVNASTL